MYLVDTNVLSEARRGNPQAQRWFRSVDPSITVMEFFSVSLDFGDSFTVDLSREYFFFRHFFPFRRFPISGVINAAWQRPQ